MQEKMAGLDINGFRPIDKFWKDVTTCSRHWQYQKLTPLQRGHTEYVELKGICPEENHFALL